MSALSSAISTRTRSLPLWAGVIAVIVAAVLVSGVAVRMSAGSQRSASWTYGWAIAPAIACVP